MWTLCVFIVVKVGRLCQPECAIHPNGYSGSVCLVCGVRMGRKDRSDNTATLLHSNRHTNIHMGTSGGCPCPCSGHDHPLAVAVTVAFATGMGRKTGPGQPTDLLHECRTANVHVGSACRRARSCCTRSGSPIASVTPWLGGEIRRDHQPTVFYSNGDANLDVGSAQCRGPAHGRCQRTCGQVCGADGHVQVF